MWILFYFSFIWLHVYEYAFKSESKVHCGSALGPGACRLTYYFTPPVCVPAVLGGLAVWRQTTKNTKQIERLRSATVRDSFLGPKWVVGCSGRTLTLYVRLSQLRVTDLFFAFFLETKITSWQCRTPALFLGSPQLCVFSLEISLPNLEMNGPDVVAKGCTHFPQLLVWERKKKPEVGTEVGKGIRTKRKEIWPFLCRILFNCCSNLLSLCGRYIC